MLVRNGAKLLVIRRSFTARRPDKGVFSKMERREAAGELNIKYKFQRGQNFPAIDHFHDINFILIDFEAIDDNICEFPALHVKNGKIQNIFHSYCRKYVRILYD
jgi:hypothetical protein